MSTQDDRQAGDDAFVASVVASAADRTQACIQELVEQLQNLISNTKSEVDDDKKSAEEAVIRKRSSKNQQLQTPEHMWALLTNNWGTPLLTTTDDKNSDNNNNISNKDNKDNKSDKSDATTLQKTSDPQAPLQQTDNTTILLTLTSRFSLVCAPASLRGWIAQRGKACAAAALAGVLNAARGVDRDCPSAVTQAHVIVVYLTMLETRIARIRNRIADQLAVSRSGVDDMIESLRCEVQKRMMCVAASPASPASRTRKKKIALDRSQNDDSVDGADGEHDKDIEQQDEGASTAVEENETKQTKKIASKSKKGFDWINAPTRSKRSKAITCAKELLRDAGEQQSPSEQVMIDMIPGAGLPSINEIVTSNTTDVTDTTIVGKSDSDQKYLSDNAIGEVAGIKSSTDQTTIIPPLWHGLCRLMNVQYALDGDDDDGNADDEDKEDQDDGGDGDDCAVGDSHATNNQNDDNQQDAGDKSSRFPSAKGAMTSSHQANIAATSTTTSVSFFVSTVDWHAQLLRLMQLEWGRERLAAQPSPSTALIGNWGILEAASSALPEAEARARIVACREIVTHKYQRRSTPLVQTDVETIRVSTNDSSEQQSMQWATLQRLISEPRSALVLHLPNHYAMLFAARSWEDALSGQVYQEILTAPKGQSPKTWMPWERMRALMLRKSMYQIIQVQLNDPVIITTSRDNVQNDLQVNADDKKICDEMESKSSQTATVAAREISTTFEADAIKATTTTAAENLL